MCIKICSKKKRHATIGPIQIAPEAFDHYIHEAKQRKVKTQVPDYPIERSDWKFCRVWGEERPQACEDMSRDREPGNRIGDRVQRLALRFLSENILTIAQYTQQEGHEVEQQPFVFEVDQRGQRPTPEAKYATDNKAVYQPDEENPCNSPLERYIVNLDL